MSKSSVQNKILTSHANPAGTVLSKPSAEIENGPNLPVPHKAQIHPKAPYKFKLDYTSKRNSLRPALKSAEIGPKTYTIQKIESAGNKVWVHLSHPLPLSSTLMRQSIPKPETLPKVPFEVNLDSTIKAENSADHRKVLVLTGNFQVGKWYTLVWPKNFRLYDRVYRESIHRFKVKPAPEISYFDEKDVVELKGRQLIHFQSNVDTLLLKTLKIPPALFSIALEQLSRESLQPSKIKPKKMWKQWSENLKRVMGNISGSIESDPFFKILNSQLREERQVFHAEKSNRTVPVSLPLTFRPDSDSGSLELIRLQDEWTQEKIVSPMRLVSVTDLALTYKRGRDSFLAWVTSLNGGTPVAGVQLFAIDRNKRIFALGKTDAEGILLYKESPRQGLKFVSQSSRKFMVPSSPKPLFPDYRVKKIQKTLQVDEITHLMAITPNDVSTLEFNHNNEFTPRQVMFSPARTHRPAEFKAKVFTDRGMYRPGETVHFKGVMRRFKSGDVVADTSQVNVKIKDSKGETIFSSIPEVSPFGSISGHLPLEGHFPLGTYTITLEYGEHQKVRHSFEVQEFRAPRHFTRVSFLQPHLRTDTTFATPRGLTFVDIQIEAGYYAGGPVKNGQVRWKIYHAGTRYDDTEETPYRFGNDLPDKILLESSESILDPDGKLKISFPLDSAILSGQRSLEVVATVIDFDGRAFTSNNRYQIRPDWLIGIGKHPKKIKAGDSLPLPVLVKPGEAILPEKSHIDFQVYREEYQYLRKRNQKGELYWDWTRNWSRHYTGKTHLESGRGQFDFTPAFSGKYQIVFSLKRGDRTYRSSTYLQVGWGWRNNRRDLPFQKVEILMDREQYRAGQTAELTLQPKAPISHYLMTLEKDGVLHHRVFPATGESETLQIPLEEVHAPNVYVSVMGTIARSDFPVYSRSVDEGAPSFRLGTVNLPVVSNTEDLHIQLGADAETLTAQPGSEFKLDLTVTDSQGRPVKAEIALGVIDERVLALTDFKTPDLRSLGRFTLPLQVRTADLRTALASQTPLSWIWNPAWTGGGGLESPFSLTTLRKNFNPVAYFNPKLNTDDQGRVQVQFHLPDTMTTYRIYAVAIDRASSFGNAQKGLHVAKDFYIEPGLPLFFTRGDQFRFSVSAFNATDSGGPAELNLSPTRNLQFKMEQRELDIPAGDSARFSVQGEALRSGTGTVFLHGRLGAREDAVALDVPVHSGHTVETRILMGSFDGSSRVPFPLPDAVTLGASDPEFLKDVHVEWTFSTSPFLNLAQGLEYVMKYPYGCVEQTSSGVMPLAALRGWVLKNAIPGIEIGEVDNFLESGVARLMSMQTESGGFAYWPGRTKPHREGTLYALAALSVAKKNGYPVPEKPFARALAYLKKEVDMGEFPADRAFVYYILALNGAVDTAQTRQLLKTFTHEKAESAYFWILVGHLTQAWDGPTLSAWMAQRPPVETVAARYGEFNNRFRIQAIALLAGLALDPDGPGTHHAVTHLLHAMDASGRWGPTSDTGWVLFALGEYYRLQATNGIATELTVQPGDAATAALSLREGPAFLTVDPKTFLDHPRLDVRGEPGKTVFYRARLRFPRTDYAESGHINGWKVSKTIENLDGTDHIRVGDLVKVRIRIESDSQHSGTRYKYLVLDDPLPAGLVAINSALKTEESAEDLDPKGDRYYDPEEETWKFVPNHVEFRDDRVLAFKNRFYTWGVHQFTYYARAVTEGEFVLPATKVQLMYAPDIHGFTPISKLTIQGR